MRPSPDAPRGSSHTPPFSTSPRPDPPRDLARDPAPARPHAVGEPRHDEPAEAARTRGMLRQLGKHQVASLIATVVDFGTLIGLVELRLLGPVRATIAGASFGAAANFTLGRYWIFSAQHRHARSQAARYALVSVVSLGLNALGEHLLAGRLRVQYVAARAIVAVIVSLAWNFPMQRGFVFRH